MFFRILTTMLLGSVSICFSQDQIILRNKDTISCKLTNLDQYYTYFISPENTSHILQVSNVHVKKIHNVTFTKQKAWLYPNKDTSDYKTYQKVTTTKFKKNPNAVKPSAENKESQVTSNVSAGSDTSQIAPLHEESFFLGSFSLLPLNTGISVNNSSLFKYNNTQHGTFALNLEYIKPNSIGITIYGGYSTYTYDAAYISANRNLNASFQKRESGIALGIGPNIAYRTSKSSFVKTYMCIEGLIRPKLKYKEIELSNDNQTYSDNIHTGNGTNSESKIGINLGLSYHKQLNDVLVFSFGIGYKGMKQKVRGSDKIKNETGTLELNDRLGFQTEHFLTSVLSIGARF